jgi:hypothetical protein
MCALKIHVVECHSLHSKIGPNYVTNRLYVQIFMVHHVAVARNGSFRTVKNIPAKLLSVTTP